MTIARFVVINMVRAAAGVAAVDHSYATPELREPMTSISNLEHYSAASYEDYSINWSDYSFEYLAEK